MLLNPCFAVTKSSRQPSLVQRVVLCLVTSLAVAVLLAPVVTQGWCYDAAVSDGESLCGSRQTSLLGIESNPWLWIAATLVGIAVTLLLTRPLSSPHENA